LRPASSAFGPALPSFLFTVHTAKVSMLAQSTIFPSNGYRILSALIHFLGKKNLAASFFFVSLYPLGVSILSHCVSRRTNAGDFSSFSGLRNISWPRLCIILIFVDSWLFLFISSFFLVHTLFLVLTRIQLACSFSVWDWNRAIPFVPPPNTCVSHYTVRQRH